VLLCIKTVLSLSIITVVDAVSVHLNKANTESATVIFTLLILHIKKKIIFVF